jgi:hypothetical protein
MSLLRRLNLASLAALVALSRPLLLSRSPLLLPTDFILLKDVTQGLAPTTLSAYRAIHPRDRVARPVRSPP